MRERVGVIKKHYFSGLIETYGVLERGEAVQMLESQSAEFIETLPPLPKGSFYAFHAERIATPQDLQDFLR